MIRALRSHALRLGVRTLARAVARWPRIVFRIADALGLLIFRPMSESRLREVFPELTPERAHEIALRARRVSMRNIVLAEHIRLVGYEGPRRSICVPDARLKVIPRRTIIGTFHVGALSVIGVPLLDLPAGVLVLKARSNRAGSHANLTIEVTLGDDQHRARVFHRAIQFLQADNFVFMPLDPEESARIAVPFHGRNIQLARGPFALSRITGAPILPMIAHWNGSKVECVLGDLIPASSDEAAGAAAAAAWFERYLDEHPLEISARVLMLTD